MAEQEFSDEERAAAYEYARQKIEEANAADQEYLNLGLLENEGKTKALSVIPSEAAELGKLIRLDLRGTQVTDLSPLRAMAGLQVLNLGYTNVVNIAPIQAVTRLQELHLEETQVADLSSLHTLTGLQLLGLNNTQVADLSPLQALTSMETLYLDNTQVADLSPLQALTGLQTLTLDYTQVGDLSHLQALTELQTLTLNKTQVSGLSPLRALTGLQVLWLNDTQVADLSPLQALTGLQWLTLNRTQVADLSPLRALPGLEVLGLNNTQVADLSLLQALTGLQRLFVNDTRVKDLSPLHALTGLQTLALGNTQVADMLPLAGLSKLGEGVRDGLWFSGTPAADRDDAHRALAAIEDDQDRAKQVLQYLNGEHPEFGGPPEPYSPPKLPSPPEQQRGGVRFQSADDYLVPLIEGEIRDRAEKMLPIVIEALEALTQPLPGSNDFPGPAKWAADALRLARRDLEEINADGWRLWSLSQKFARRQTADDAAQSDASGMAKVMGPEMREALDGVVDTLPLFVRQFPECRYYDSETADRRDRAAEPAVAEVFDDVARFEIVRPDLAGALQDNVPVEDGGKEADRQAGFNLLSAQNLVYAGVGLVVTAAVGTVVTETVGGAMDGLGTRPAIEQRVREWMTSKPDPIEGVLKGAPKDVQASVRSHIDRLKAEPAPWEVRLPPKKPDPFP